jgi:hypothetical protein
MSTKNCKGIIWEERQAEADITMMMPWKSTRALLSLYDRVRVAHDEAEDVVKVN